jgi:hypothetical protein
MSADKHRAKTRRMNLLRLLFPTVEPPFFPADRVADVRSLARLVKDGLVKIIKRDHHSIGRYTGDKLSRNKRTYVQRLEDR